MVWCYEVGELSYCMDVEGFFGVYGCMVYDINYLVGVNIGVIWCLVEVM